MSEPIWVCGIDLGGKTTRTTGVCFLKVVRGKPKFDRRRCNFCQVIHGQDLLPYLKPHLSKMTSSPASQGRTTFRAPNSRVSKIKVIAIDAPLTLGPGKGKMRLWEKFFSTRPFRRQRVSPIPPAAIWRLSYHGMEVVSQLGSYGFKLDENLIETFPTFAKKVLKRLPKVPCSTQDERDAFVCALVAAHHLVRKTFWIGHRDGKLFLPSLSFWKKDWRERFKKLWQEKHPFKYKFLRLGGYP